MFRLFSLKKQKQKKERIQFKDLRMVHFLELRRQHYREDPTLKQAQLLITIVRSDTFNSSSKNKSRTLTRYPGFL